MIIQCERCLMYFDDVYRSTICTHDTFLANDGSNNFAHHPESYLSNSKPANVASVTINARKGGGDDSK